MKKQNSIRKIILKRKTLILVFLIAFVIFVTLIMNGCTPAKETDKIITPEGLVLEFGNFGEDKSVYFIVGVTDKISGSFTIPETYKGNSIVGINYAKKYDFNSVTAITIPASIKFIYNRFEYHSKLKKFEVSEENEYFKSIDGVLYSKDGTLLLRYPPAKESSDYSALDSTNTINDYAFYGCYNLTKVNLPNGIEEFKYYAFANCINLTEMPMPLMLKSIGNSAFINSNITSIEFPEAIERIDSYAFTHSDNLSIVSLPLSIKYISPSAFRFCASLTAIKITEGNEKYYDIDGVLFERQQKVYVDKSFEVGDMLITFPKNKSTEYTIPEGIKFIASDVFAYNKKIKHVTINEDVISIGEIAFRYCDNLETVNIPGSIKTIASGTFSHCKNLINVTISDGVERIGNNAFFGCKSLVSVYIPASVTIVDGGAFCDCSALALRCEAVSKPSSWNENWNCIIYEQSGAKAEWGVPKP